MPISNKPSFCSPSQAAYASKRARQMHTAGQLTAHQYAIFDHLLWDAREAGADRVTASYRWLQKLGHVCRAAVAGAIKRFVELGLVVKVKRKRLILWANGGKRWEQLTNEYVFCCESAGQTESPKEDILILNLTVPAAVQRHAQAALDKARRLIEARLLNKAGARSPPA